MIPKRSPKTRSLRREWVPRRHPPRGISARPAPRWPPGAMPEASVARKRFDRDFIGHFQPSGRWEWSCPTLLKATRTQLSRSKFLECGNRHHQISMAEREKRGYSPHICHTLPKSVIYGSLEE